MRADHVTSPTASRSREEGIHMSTIIWDATRAPTMRTRWIDEHPSGDTFHQLKGRENVASSEETMASQRVACVTPAPNAGPFTAATIGFGKLRNTESGFEWSESVDYTATISVKAAPEQK